MPHTNTAYVRNLVDAAIQAEVQRFILVSFPHVEGPTTPQRPATGRMDAQCVISVHARTRLAAEQYLLKASSNGSLQPVVLRAGTIYGRGVLMIETARWLLRHRLLAVWRDPTWYHFLSLADFLDATSAAIRKESVRGTYNVADDRPLPLQEFLDRIADHWRLPRPWRLPRTVIWAAAACVEFGALLLGTAAPLTRDFIRIGMVPHVMDTTRMREKLLPNLIYPTIEQGLSSM